MLDSLKLEQSILGCIFRDTNLLQDIDTLHTDSFSSDKHRKTLYNLKKFSKKGIDLDLVAYTTEFPDENVVYLTGLISNYEAVTKNFGTYCKQLNSIAKKRELLNVAELIKKDIESDEIFDIAEREIYSIRETNENKSMFTSKEVIQTVVDNTYRRMDNPGLLGIDTGYQKLNNVTDGLQPGFHIIAARPGMGKTSFAIDLSLNAAIRENKKVAIFTLEMSKEQIYTKMIIQESMIEGSRVYKATMTDSEWKKFHDSANVINNQDIFISDNITELSQIVSQCRRLKRQHGIDLVIIDYLQLISCSIGSNENEVLGNISKAFVSLWKELNIPIVALAQLSRGPEMRTDRRPRLADLRGSGQIEQDALTVMMLYREEYYNPDSSSTGVVEVLIEKNRFGPCGMIKLGFIAGMTKFVNLREVAYNR